MKPHYKKMFVNYNLTSFFCVRIEYTRVLNIFIKDLSNRLRNADIPRSLELNKTHNIDQETVTKPSHFINIDVTF